MATSVEMSKEPGATDGGPLLDVRDLHVEFRTREGVAKAVNGVEYSVDAGETLAVLGRHALAGQRLADDFTEQVTLRETLGAHFYRLGMRIAR